MYAARQNKSSISRTLSPMYDIQRFKKVHSALSNRCIIQRNLLVYQDLTTDGNLKNQSKKIFFTEYNGTELKSSDFSGCLMAAFKFQRQPTINEQSNLLCLNSHVLNLNSSYVAHIYAMQTEEEGDTKYKFMQLENSGLIKIEAMFKPYDANRDGDDVYKYIINNGLQSDVKARSLTGSLTYNQGEWTAKTYYQNSNGIGAEYKTYDEQKLQNETYYFKGFLGKIIPNDELQNLSAVNKSAYKNGLRDCGKTNPSILLAHDFEKLSKGSIRKFMKGFKKYKESH